MREITDPSPTAGPAVDPRRIASWSRAMTVIASVIRAARVPATRRSGQSKTADLEPFGPLGLARRPASGRSPGRGRPTSSLTEFDRWARPRNSTRAGDQAGFFLAELAAGGLARGLPPRGRRPSGISQE